MNLTRSQRRSAIAELIRTEMTERGITQSQLCEIFDLNKATISRRYHGIASWPAEDLSILADVLNAPITFGAITDSRGDWKTGAAAYAYTPTPAEDTP